MAIYLGYFQFGTITHKVAVNMYLPFGGIALVSVSYIYQGMEFLGHWDLCVLWSDISLFSLKKLFLISNNVESFLPSNESILPSNGHFLM